jgi:hypothetical protein
MIKNESDSEDESENESVKHEEGKLSIKLH